MSLTTFFKYPVELRRMIHTINAIESLHSQMRKNISNRKVFPNDEAVIKILFLNIRNFANRWTKRQGWDIAAKLWPIRGHSSESVDDDFRRSAQA